MQAPASKVDTSTAVLPKTASASALHSGKQAGQTVSSHPGTDTEEPDLHSIPSRVAGEAPAEHPAVQLGPVELGEEQPAAVSIEERAPERSYFKRLHAPQQQHEHNTSTLQPSCANTQQPAPKLPPPSPFATADLEPDGTYPADPALLELRGDPQLQRITQLVSS